MGFAAGLSAGVAAGKAGRAAWEARADKKRDKEISKGLEANAQEDLAAADYAEDLDDYGGPLGEEFDDVGDQVGKERSEVERLIADRSVYSKYGDDEGAKGLDAEIKVARRQEFEDNRYDTALGLVATNREEDLALDATNRAEAIEYRDGQDDKARFKENKEKAIEAGEDEFYAKMTSGGIKNTNDARKLAVKLGLRPEFASEAYASFRQATKADVDAASVELQDNVRDLKNGDEYISFFNDDKNNTTPGTSITKSNNEQGHIVVSEKDDESGEEVFTQTFGSDRQMMSWFQERAKSPAAAMDYLINTEAAARKLAMDEVKTNAGFADKFIGRFQTAMTAYKEDNPGFRSLTPGEKEGVENEQREKLAIMMGRTLRSGGGSSKPKKGDIGSNMYETGLDDIVRGLQTERDGGEKVEEVTTPTGPTGNAGGLGAVIEEQTAANAARTKVVTDWWERGADKTRANQAASSELSADIEALGLSRADKQAILRAPRGRVDQKVLQAVRESLTQ